MFAHEAPYDCTFCGSEWCYGSCRNDGVDIVYGGDSRVLEVLPTLQTAPDNRPVRTGQEPDGRPMRALPEVSSGLPFTAKAYSRNYLSRRNRFADTQFDSIGTMEFF